MNELKTIDVSAMIVMYNLVVGILVVLASDKIASFATPLGTNVKRYAKVSVLTFGTCVTALSGFIYVLFHWLKMWI